MELRPSNRVPIAESNRSMKRHIGVTPYGYRCLRGRLILDAKEIETVHLIMSLWNSGKSYSAIARQLTSHGLTNRRGTDWEHSLVRSIVARPKNKPIILEEKSPWDSNR